MKHGKKKKKKKSEVFVLRIENKQRRHAKKILDLRDIWMTRLSLSYVTEKIMTKEGMPKNAVLDISDRRVHSTRLV